MDLRSALAISGLAHILFLAPYFNTAVFPVHPEDKRYGMELDYVRIEDYQAKPPAPVTMQEKKDVLSASDKAAETETKQPARVAVMPEEKALERNKDYVSYYQIVRDQIRRELNENYRRPSEEGDVYLEFTINEDGDLVGYGIDRSRSTSSAALLKIAEASLKATPFPPPPEGIRASRISFNVTVSFKKN